MTGDDHQLQVVEIGDESAGWSEAGFAVDGDRVTVGSTVLHLVGATGGRGIRSVSVEGIQSAVDGMPFTGAATLSPGSPRHLNGVVSFDHLVAISPHMDRTTSALEAVGLAPRRSRTFGADDDQRRQTFFWLGDVILELAGSDTAADPGPALLWGLAFTTDDLDGAVAHLGTRIGAPKNAVQKGRRIATIRTRDLDISAPIALMTPHGVEERS